MIIRVIIGILLFYVVSSFGAWMRYPDYFFHPYIIVLVWISEFPIFSFEVFVSTLFGIIAFMMIVLENNMFRIGKYGYARFAKKRDIKKLGLNFKDGIVLGKAFGKYIKSKSPLSVLILAPPGTGKTAGVVIPTLLTIRNSVVVHDPKGELYDVTARSRSKFSEIYLFDYKDPNSAKFNPFAKEMLPQDKRDEKGYIRNLANILFKETKEGDKYFMDAARSAFNFFTEWLIWKQGYTSLPEIRNKLLEEANVASTIRTMLAEDNISEELKRDGNGVLISSDSEKQWAGVVGTLKETIEIFADPRIKDITSGGCDFTAKDIRDNLTSIYLKVRDEDAKRLEPIVTMLFEALGKQLISELPNKTDKQVTFILDEFVRLGKTEIIRDLPSISRGYNVNTMFVAQDYEQIAVKYGREAVSIFDSNCAYKIVFQQNNLQTAEKISKLIGNKTDVRKSSSKSTSSRQLQNSSSGVSKSLSQEGVPLVTPQDILNLNKKTCFIVSQGYSAFPIKAKVAYYFKDRYFQSLLKVNYEKEKRENN